MARNCERARWASEKSFSAVDCIIVIAFRKEVGDGSDLGVGLRYCTVCGVCEEEIVCKEVAKQWS